MSSKRIIFITSLERSGSTLLDITLGKHPQLVSFGEVARVLLPHGGGGMESVIDRPCSCGASVKDCAFWGKVTEKISLKENELTLAERYEIFFTRFDEIYGNYFIPVDSSKFLRSIETLHAFGDKLDLRVLFTIRDVRGWCSSSRRAGRRKQEIPYSAIFSSSISEMWKAYLRYNVLRHIPFWLPLEWYIRNQSIDGFLLKNGLPTQHLSYEGFAFNTAEVMHKLYKFAGIDELPLNEKCRSHIVRGNRMAFDPDKLAAISYDAEWLSEIWSQYEPVIWPFVMIKNKQWVYSGH